jgi:hypothetical protein
VIQRTNARFRAGTWLEPGPIPQSVVLLGNFLLVAEGEELESNILQVAQRI